MKRAWIGLTVGATVAALLWVVVPAASAREGFVTDASMYSERGEHIGAGVNRVWGADDVAVSGSLRDELVVKVAGGESGAAFTMSFAAPRGEELTSGRYDEVRRPDDRSGRYAGMDVTGEGRHCQSVSGWFYVHYLSDQPRRVDLEYEMHCDGADAALFGEVRFEVYDQAVEFQTLPSRVSWPDTPVGTGGAQVPVTLLNPGPDAVSFETATLKGGDATSPVGFAVDSARCGDLPAGDSCDVMVRFTPTAAGWNGAILTLSTSLFRKEVVLRGFAEDGPSSWSMHSDAGDPLGPGPSDLDFDRSNSVMSVGGDPRRIEVGLNSSGRYFNATFVAPVSRPLAAGERYNITAPPPSRSPEQPEMTITGDTYACSDFGRFDVQEAVFSAGRLRRLRLTYEIHCGDHVAGSTGSIAWLASAPAAPVPTTALVPPPTPLPPAVTNLRATSSGRESLLEWTKPSYPGYDHTVVRGALGQSAPPSPTDGFDVYCFRGRSADIGPYADGRDHAFSVFTVDRGGEASDPTSVTLVGTRVTHGVSSSDVDSGDSVVLSGRLLDSSGQGIAGKQLDIIDDVDIAEQADYLDTVTTDEDGNWTFEEKLDENRNYRVTYEGSDVYMNSAYGPWSPVTVTPHAQLTADRHTARKGAAFNLKANVSLPHHRKVNRSVVLQRYSKGAWHKAGTARLSRKGHATFKVRAVTHGRHSYRLVKKAQKELGAGRSRTVRLRVR